MSTTQLAFSDWRPDPSRPPRPPRLDITVLRPYQHEAVEAIFRQFRVHRSTLLVLPTGAGKTTVFGEVARESYPDRVLVIAHRDELIDQARRRLQEMTREMVGLEQARYWSTGERVVVGSVQSIGRAGRLARFKDDPPDLIIVDEAHHAVANSYRAILDAFPRARILGVTATPDRADGSALEQVFSTVAYSMDVTEVMDLGYLVPLQARRLQLEHADLTHVRTTAGDLNLGDLDEQMAKENEHVAQMTLALAEGRKTIVFSTKVQTAWDLVEHFNKEAGRTVAVAVDGEMHSDDRRRALSEHADPDSGVDVLVNVGIATEGYDCPLVSCVAIARPTKSRALYTQMVGRALRPLKGVVDNEYQASHRQALIAASAKPHALLLDFSPTAGKHRLIGPEDILGGKGDCDETVAAAAREVMSNSMADVREAMRLARELVEADRKVRAALIGSVKATVRSRVDELDVFGGGAQEYPVGPRGPLYATREQVNHLVHRFGWHESEARGLSMAEATRHTRRGYLRKKLGLATWRMERKLEQYGVADADKLTFKAASAVLDAMAKQGWRALAPSEIHTIVRNADRKPGEEG